MRLRAAGAVLDLREWGLNSLSVSEAVRTGELPLTDGAYHTEALGMGARSIELGGEFRSVNLTALTGWGTIINWALAEERIEVAQYFGGQPAVLGDYFIAGNPRLTYVELLNGEPVAYRWRLRLLQASPPPPP